MCAGADETCARSVWPQRRATVLTNVPRTLEILERLWVGGKVSSKDVGEWLDVVYRSLDYEDANDMSLKWEVGDDDEEEEEEERVIEEESQVRLIGTDRQWLRPERLQEHREREAGVLFRCPMWGRKRDEKREGARDVRILGEGVLILYTKEDFLRHPHRD